MAAEGDPVSDRPVRPRSAAQTRGFLFADIRGYTEYVEREGAQRATDLLARYRQVVRAAIAEHDGAEIRTEGNSFYVVLPTASAAVMCAVSIVDRVEAANGHDPTRPIRVGVGVHAGEALDTEEGLVGSAVNIASRLAAMAKPGEILVTETVRTLTRSVAPVTYRTRGRHKLKGVAEPQEVFAATNSVTDATSQRPSRRLRGTLAVAVGAVGLAVIALVLYKSIPASSAPGASDLIAKATATPTSTIGELPINSASLPALTARPTSSTTPSPAPSGPTTLHLDPDLNPGLGLPVINAGSYRFSSFRPILAFQVDPHWTDRKWYAVSAASDITHLASELPGADSAWFPVQRIKPGLMLLSFVRLQTVIGNPCNGGDTTSYRLLGGRPSDVVNWLSNQQFLEATNIQPAEVAGWTGLSVDVTVKGDPGKFCSGTTVAHQGSVHLFATTNSPLFGKVYSIRDGEEARFTIVDIGQDAPLVFISRSSLDDFSSQIPWSQDLIDTISVLPDQ